MLDILSAVRPTHVPGEICMHFVFLIPVLALVVQFASTLLAIGLIRRSGRRSIAVMLFVIILLISVLVTRVMQKRDALQY